VPKTARLVVVAFVVVLLATVSPVMFAIDAVSELKMPVVKLASEAKRFVLVAFVATRLVVVALCAMTPVEDAAANEIDPAVTFPPTLRLPKREVSPLAERLDAATELDPIRGTTGRWI